MSLATGANIVSSRWTLLPISEDAIACVEAIAYKEGQPLIQRQGLIFEWSPGHIVDLNEYDGDYVPNDESDSDDDDNDDTNQYDDIDDDEVTDLHDRNWQAPKVNGDEQPQEPLVDAGEQEQGYMSPNVSSDDNANDDKEEAAALEEEGAAKQALDHDEEGAPAPDEEGAMDFDDEESDHNQAGNNGTAPHVYNLPSVSGMPLTPHTVKNRISNRTNCYRLMRTTAVARA
jgi:hypothetical protein